MVLTENQYGKTRFTVLYLNDGYNGYNRLNVYEKHQFSHI